MRILVCGGRDFKDYAKFKATLNELLPTASNDEPPPDMPVIIHGGATGADTMAETWAAFHWAYIEEYPADWETHGRAAGPLRNQKMLEEGKPDLVVAFPGGAGTADMVRRAKAAGIRVIEVT